MTNASVQEWQEINRIIHLFCLVSGLKVNLSKSSVHFSGLEETKLHPLKQLLSYNFSDLKGGFKYLGYFLKHGVQKTKDWLWLVNKVEKKISHWSFRWLSLGGRHTLCKSVLENESVYWLSLVVVPLSILQRIRKLLINFLWKGNTNTHHYHLANWESLAQPKRFGGWGLLNIIIFSKALTTTTLWRALTSNGLWKKVLKEKYLHSVSVIKWLRSETFAKPSTSKIWKNLLKTVHIINNWLTWKLGSGSLVELGRDRILDMGTRSFLSARLWSTVHQKHITVLAHTWKTLHQSSNSP